MTGKPEESVAKRSYNITLNPELVEQARAELHVDSLSGWLNDKLREAILNHRIIFECSCGCTAGIGKWNEWLLICPTCKSDHARLDRRKRIKLEG